MKRVVIRTRVQATVIEKWVLEVADDEKAAALAADYDEALEALGGNDVDINFTEVEDEQVFDEYNRGVISVDVEEVPDGA